MLARTRRVLNGPPEGPKPTLLVFGNEFDQRRLVRALASTGLLAGFNLVLQVRAATVPLDPSLADLFRLAELLVTDSAFGAAAVTHCCLEAGTRLRRPPVVIPAAIGWDPARVDPRDRRASLRRDSFGVGDDDLLIGCGVGGPADPRQSVALQIFRIFADGLYWLCARCDFMTPFETDDGLRPIPVSTCARCGVAEGHPGNRWPAARLFLADRGAGAERGVQGGLGAWSVRDIRRWLGLEGRVLIEGDERLPRADSMATMMQRLSCLDVHLVPHHLADVEPILLASCAIGVPAITTRFGSAQELLGRAARLVEPAVTLDDSSGHRTAIMDAAEGVRELRRLAQDAHVRAALGASARAAMRAHDDTVVIPHWLEHLERLAEAVR